MKCLRNVMFQKCAFDPVLLSPVIFLENFGKFQKHLGLKIQLINPKCEKSSKPRNQKNLLPIFSIKGPVISLKFFKKKKSAPKTQKIGKFFYKDLWCRVRKFLVHKGADLKKKFVKFWIPHQLQNWKMSINFQLKNQLPIIKIKGIIYIFEISEIFDIFFGKMWVC